jgi:hypothetical protein
MKLREFMFRSCQEKQLAHLQGKVQVMLHGGRRTPLDFYCLGKNLEAYRDFVADYLEGLPLVERSAAEDQLWPGVKALVEKVGKLADEGQAAGIIDEAMVYDLGILGNSLLFVSAFSKLVVEPTSQNLNPRRR